MVIGNTVNVDNLRVRNNIIKKYIAGDGQISAGVCTHLLYIRIANNFYCPAGC